MADVIGRLDRRLKIMLPASVQDPATGEVTETWSELVTVWASKRQLSGREIEQAAQTKSTEQLKFRIRYRRGLDTTMRVECEGVPYAVTRMEEIGRRHWLDVYARRT